MEMITDNVKEMGMWQLAHNQFFIKDGEAWYRDFDREISCRNLIRELTRIYGDDGAEAQDFYTDDDYFDEAMIENLQYGHESLIGLIAMYYFAMWPMAELRASLIEARVKQIPKPVPETEKPDCEEDIKRYGEDALFGCCPVCKEYESSLWNSKYCGKCGQAIDWSVKE